MASTSESLLKEVEWKERSLKTLKKDIIDLRRESWRLWQEENPNATVVEKFEHWLDEGPKSQNYRWVQHLHSSSGKDLFQYDGIAVGPEAHHKTIMIEDVGEAILYHYKTIEKNGEAGDYFRSLELTKQDLEDWMNQLMDGEFNSMVYDW